MIRALIYLAIITCLAIALAWFIDQPGSVQINFASYELLFSPMQFLIVTLIAVVGLILTWVFTYKLVSLPNSLVAFLKKRREKTGLQALASGLIAISIGDRIAASKYASLAKSSLPNNPLTDLLRAQAAQLTGDRATARRIYEAMLSSPDTEILGLRGLFLEAQQEKEDIAALQFASRAVILNPKLSWSVNALFDFQCRTGDWDGALKSLEIAEQNKLIDRALARRRRAVLLTAQAKGLSDKGENIDKAITLSLEAHNLAPDLVPAAEIAGRLLASKGHLSKAAKIITRTWKRAPHPDLSHIYAYARPGDSPYDRLERVRSLAALTPQDQEGFIAIALCAIEARDWAQARKALHPFLEQNPSARICTLMARLENEENGNAGRVREWLSRALRAPKDPVWIADGQTSDHWLPVSPVTGLLDQFEWKIPAHSLSIDETLKIEPTATILEQLEQTSNDGQKKSQPEQVKQSLPLPDLVETKNDNHHEPETYSGNGTVKGNEGKYLARSEPAIFISPRAPDDPGDGRKKAGLKTADPYGDGEY